MKYCMTIVRYPYGLEDIIKNIIKIKTNLEFIFLVRYYTNVVQKEKYLHGQKHTAIWFLKLGD